MASKIESADVGAKEAMGMSILQNRIVRIVDLDGSQSIVLDEESEGESLTSEGVDYWGTRASDGGEWRVIVVATPKLARKRRSPLTPK